MSRNRKNAWLVVAIVIAIACTVCVWWQLLTSPGHMILGLGGDTAKNYFTFLYHSLYEHGTWFHGMNYPWGEHIVYADGQPLISIPLGYLRQSISLTPEKALAIMHLLILVGFTLGIVYVYKLLVHFRLHPVAAIVFALLIILLSPQMIRVFGHFGLSYMCIIPMLFYWTVKYNESLKLRYAVYFFILGCIASFMHPYFAGLTFIWTGLYAVGYVCMNKGSLWQKIKQLLPLLIATIGIIVFVKLFMHFTDPLTDRPTYPYGTLTNCTTGIDIFTSDRSPLSRALGEVHVFSEISAGREGATYLGLAAFIITIISLVVIAVKAIRRKKDADSVFVTHGFSPIWLIVAAGALLLGMGVPFVWHMDWLLDYLSVFRQFRSLGRFSWIFYYIITIYSAVVLYHWFFKQLAGRRRIAAYAGLCVAIAIWSIDVAGNITTVKKELDGGASYYDFFIGHNLADWHSFFKEKNLDSRDIQAILVLPYSHNGSEKLWLFNDAMAWDLVLAQRIALQMRLPIVNVCMSRSSWSQTFSQVRIAGGPYANKPLMDLKDNRPYLVVRRTNTELDPDQQYLLDAASFMGNYGDLDVYKLYPSAIREKDATLTSEVMNVSKHMPAGDTCLNCNGMWLTNHFDGGDNKYKLMGTGAGGPNGKSYRILAFVPFSPKEPDQLYEFSIWALANSYDFRVPYFDFECYADSEKLIGVYNPATSYFMDNNGMWFRYSHYFKMPGNTRKIRVVFWDNNSNYRGFDELMIRPAGGTVISKFSDGSVMANNHILIKAGGK